MLDLQRISEKCSFAQMSLVCQAMLLLLMASVFFNTNYSSAQPSLVASTEQQNSKFREIQELEQQRYDSKKLLLSQKAEKVGWNRQMEDFKGEQASLREYFQRRLEEQKILYDQQIAKFKENQLELEVTLRTARQDIKALQNDFKKRASDTKPSSVLSHYDINSSSGISNYKTKRSSRPKKTHSLDTRAIVTINLRPTEGHASHYCTKNLLRMGYYAKTVGADFFVVNTTDHESLTLNNPDLDVHFYKFIVIQYYLERYDAVLWLDDTMLLNAKCSCTPDIFELSDDMVAARDGMRPEISYLCTQIRNTTVYWERYKTSKMFARDAIPCRKLKYPGNFDMFNAGLMTFRRKHLKIFEDFREIWEMRAKFSLRSGDQAVFNFLMYYHGFKWVNINEPIKLVDQGSKLTAIIQENLKLPCIGHATKGSRHWRNALLCDEWDFCLREDYFTTNETIVSPLKFINTNSALGRQVKDSIATHGAISWNDALEGVDCLFEIDAASKIDETPILVPDVSACQYMCQAHTECKCIVFLDGKCTRLPTCNTDQCYAQSRTGIVTMTGIRSPVSKVK